LTKQSAGGSPSIEDGRMDNGDYMPTNMRPGYTFGISTRSKPNAWGFD